MGGPGRDFKFSCTASAWHVLKVLDDDLGVTAAAFKLSLVPGPIMATMSVRILLTSHARYTVTGTVQAASGPWGLSHTCSAI